MGSSTSFCVGIIFLFFSERMQCWSPDGQLSSTQVNNGALQLVLKGFVDEILREVENELRINLSQDIRARLKSRYKNIHNRLIQHPAFQERRLWVGGNKPTFDPEPVGYIKMRQTKNRRHLAIPDESCQTQRLWELVNETIDINGRKVEVIQEQDALQYVFVYRCESSAIPCSGINNKFLSECEMRSGWAMMYHRVLDDPESEANWGFVAIPHHCACKIIEKIPL